MGYDKIVLVLTRPLEYRKKPSSMALFKWIYRGYPHLIERWQQRYQDYNQTVERIIQLNQAQQIFVIRPSQTIPLSRLEKILTSYNKCTIWVFLTLSRQYLRYVSIWQLSPNKLPRTSGRIWQNFCKFYRNSIACLISRWLFG
ncbi:RssA protein [Actinobacillus equuli]|nr:RssA protein [Actinobacillus equuli]